MGPLCQRAGVTHALNPKPSERVKPDIQKISYQEHQRVFLQLYMKLFKDAVKCHFGLFGLQKKKILNVTNSLLLKQRDRDVITACTNTYTQKYILRLHKEICHVTIIGHSKVSFQTKEKNITGRTVCPDLNQIQ